MCRDNRFEIEIGTGWQTLPRRGTWTDREQAPSPAGGGRMPISPGITGHSTWACAGDTIMAVAANTAARTAIGFIDAPFAVTYALNTSAFCSAALDLVRPGAGDNFGGALLQHPLQRRLLY